MYYQLLTAFKMVNQKNIFGRLSFWVDNSSNRARKATVKSTGSNHSKFDYKAKNHKLDPVPLKSKTQVDLSVSSLSRLIKPRPEGFCQTELEAPLIAH